MKNHEHPLYREALEKAVDALAIAGNEFERARQERTTKPIGRDPVELQRVEDEWRSLWGRLRDLSAMLMADVNKEWKDQ